MRCLDKVDGGELMTIKLDGVIKVLLTAYILLRGDPDLIQAIIHWLMK